MKKLHLIFLSTFLIPCFAQSAELGRSLPSGEENPEVVSQIYTSPQGEVLFTTVETAQPLHSAKLRMASGLQASLLEVHGPLSCKEWAGSSKVSAVPSGCEFMFRHDGEGSYINVQSEDMKEASLFQAVRGLLKGPYVAL